MSLTKATPLGKAAFSDALLEWYDSHHRTLPWRVSPKERARGRLGDPYRVWLSEVMLQQTTVATVLPRFQRFLERWPDVHALAAAPIEAVLAEWAGLGYYARARNLHACAVRVSTAHGGLFPDTEEGLLSLPGIGAYTAAAIAAIAFDRPATVVDGNVDRVMVRQCAIDRPIKDAKADIYSAAQERTPQKRAGDYAQALMDLGATLCRPKAPQCLLCPVAEGCQAWAMGIAEALPVKPARKIKPTRKGTVYVALKGGHVLVETRAPKGLLGGMMGLPGSAWTEDGPTACAVTDEAAPTDGAWVAAAPVRHTFTHFHLDLDVCVATVTSAPNSHQWLALDEKDALPTVFKKALVSALDHIGAA